MRKFNFFELLSVVIVAGITMLALAGVGEPICSSADKIMRW